MASRNSERTRRTKASTALARKGPPRTAARTRALQPAALSAGKKRSAKKGGPKKPTLSRRAAPSSQRRADATEALEASQAENLITTNSAIVPIVGIGTSAGGLEALELFFKHVPKRSGMAFVVVQHLDPNHKGMLVELLQRASALPVEQARDGQRVEADHVYVIPPNRDLSLLRGKLHLFPPAGASRVHLPVDFFFRSLADDQQERSIGVILSGMGSDGTLGLRSIKEKAGAAFVQAPPFP
jgi:chemotaxis response regulator CheB